MLINLVISSKNIKDLIGKKLPMMKKVFQTYLVDEFRTSCICSKCEVCICKKTIDMENPKPYRNGKITSSVRSFVVRTDAVIVIEMLMDIQIFIKLLIMR